MNGLLVGFRSLDFTRLFVKESVVVLPRVFRNLNPRKT